MKPKTTIGLVLMLGFASLLFLNFGQQVGGYMDFAEAERTGSNAHVIGDWVADQPMRYDRDANRFTFHMKDEAGNVRQVAYFNPKPENFEEAEQLVIEGHPGENGEFIAEHILVKCPSKYNDDRSIREAQATSLP